MIAEYATMRRTRIPIAVSHRHSLKGAAMMYGRK